MVKLDASASAICPLGAGLAFRPRYRSDIFANPSAIDFLEITADHYISFQREKGEELDLLHRNFTLIPHGLHLSLGSADGIDGAYLDKLAQLIDYVKPPWWSEHISFHRAGGYDVGHLSPVPCSEAALDVLCGNIARVRSVIDVPLILENITYLVAIPGEMDEARFVSELVDRTGAGLLLDVENLYINAMNHSYDALEYLYALPRQSVVQLHFAGGIEQDGFLIDSHSRPTPPEVWELLVLAMQRFPIKGAILERDEDLPPFAELASEVERAREIGRRYGRWA